MRSANDNSNHTCHIDDEECVECQRTKHAMRIQDVYVGELAMNEQHERTVIRRTPAELEARKQRRRKLSHEAQQAKKRWRSIA